MAFSLIFARPVTIMAFAAIRTSFEPLPCLHEKPVIYGKSRYSNLEKYFRFFRKTTLLSSLLRDLPHSSRSDVRLVNARGDQSSTLESNYSYVLPSCPFVSIVFKAFFFPWRTELFLIVFLESKVEESRKNTLIYGCVDLFSIFSPYMD